jgi:copper chaperone CopZ
MYEVFGMDCPGCQGGLEKLVKKIPAIQQAEANWQKKQLSESSDPIGKFKNEKTIIDKHCISGQPCFGCSECKRGRNQR